MISRLIKRINKDIHLTGEQQDILRRYLVAAQYKKGAILQYKGDLANKTYYVVSGMLREYFIADDGAETTIQLIPAGRFLYSSASYFQEISTECFLEVIENTELVYIHKQNMEKLFAEIPVLYKLTSKVHQQTIIDAHNHLIVNGMKTKEARREVFERLFPHLAGKVADKYIASFINLTPESFSKAKRKT